MWSGGVGGGLIGRNGRSGKPGAVLLASHVQSKVAEKLLGELWWPPGGKDSQRHTESGLNDCQGSESGASSQSSGGVNLNVAKRSQ